MKIQDFLSLFASSPQVQSFGSLLHARKSNKFQLKGLVGSSDACIVAALYNEYKTGGLFILNDKEEADYFYTDLKQLLPESPIYYFPASYKKPYHYEEIENANVLLRAEVLSKIIENADELPVVVTFPDALSDKVINQKSLVANTFTAKVGEKIDVSFMAELLQTYGFEATDFVYEPGQYSLRGGIIDVFSFSNEQPYRIELWGNEIESIRLFDPESQISSKQTHHFSIIPNVQDRLMLEERESLIHYMGEHLIVWIKDVEHTLDVLQKHMIKASEQFDRILKKAGGTKIISNPNQLFNSAEHIEYILKNCTLIEFGRRFEKNAEHSFSFEFKPQPSFNKDFKRLSEDLESNHAQGYLCVLVSDYVKQLDRLASIFETESPFLNYKSLHIGLREGFIDKENKILCYTDHQIFERFYRSKKQDLHSKSRSITLKELKNLQAGDFVSHIDHGIARFGGLEKIEVNGQDQEAIRLIFRDDDIMLISIHALHKISKYSGKDGAAPVMSKLGSQEWENKKKAVKRKVKDIAKDLISLYAKRLAMPGYSFSKDSVFQIELETSFIYEDTPDQAKATQQVKEDMEAAHHMDRLICGDVGFGKTEIAIRAAFKAVDNGKQVAVLVPTTILAMQHFKTFRDRLSSFPVRVEFINRFKSAKQIKETLERVKEGKTDILIGTHRIVSKDVAFKNLGLLIIDEEQKFGVAVKEKLKNLSLNMDVLTLTATPIPRTLQFSLMGARDLSVISTPPPNRQPVTTEVLVYNESILRDAISFELQRNGQVFIVHNRVSDIEEIANVILKLVPDARIGIAHGQMEGERLEKTMLKFIEGEYDVLVSTNIIESGLDIPNANTIIINRAHTFGLSDLHQMRGRVGRSNRKAFCYLLTPPLESLPIDSKKRLRTLEEFSDLGDGFKVAMRDLDIRGAGNLLGGEQSGFVNDLGYEAYHKILDEAIQELKETEFKELFKKELSLKELLTDCVVETDFQVLIPENYVSSVSERLALYTRLDNTKNREELDQIIAEVTDRFGPIPSEMRELVKIVEMRWIAEKLGIEKLVLKNGAMKAYFLPSDNEKYYKSEIFGNILNYIQSHPKIFRLKDFNKRLILISDSMKSLDTVMIHLESMSSIKEVLI